MDDKSMPKSGGYSSPLNTQFRVPKQTDTMEVVVTEQNITNNFKQTEIATTTAQQFNDSLSRVSNEDKKHKIAPLLSGFVLKHKYEKLKGFKIYAQVIISGCQPLKATSNVQKKNTTVVDTNIESDYFVSFKDTNNPNHNGTIFEGSAAGLGSNQNGGPGALKYLTPEVLHRVEEKQCREINRDMMRAMINKKMRKNKTFYELKVLHKDSDNGQSNHELEQQVVKQAILI